MKIGEWYVQTFRNGDEVYFQPSAVQKNGGFAGVHYAISVDRPRARPKPKKSSVPRGFTNLWRWVPESEVPFHRFGDR